MRKVASVTLNVIAGFFFYLVMLLAFVSKPPTAVKLGILIGFSVPAVVALSGGLALTRFRSWRRDAGIVLLCASGFTAFTIFTWACFLMDEKFQKMMGGNTWTISNDYLTGGGITVGFAVLGWVLVKANAGSVEQSAALDGDSAARPPRH